MLRTLKHKFGLVLLCPAEYIDKTQHEKLTSKSEEVGKLLNYMMNNPGSFGVKLQ